MEHAPLIAAIDGFLSTYAGVSGDYDPDYDEPGDRFTGPDASMLYSAARALESGLKPPFVHSDYGSGCYRPWNDLHAKAIHDVLVQQVNVLARS